MILAAQDALSQIFVGEVGVNILHSIGSDYSIFSKTVAIAIQTVLQESAEVVEKWARPCASALLCDLL